MSDVLCAHSGAAREGVITYTKLDASQGPWSQRPSMHTVPDTGPSSSQPGGAPDGGPDQAVIMIQSGAGAHLHQSGMTKEERRETAAEDACTGSQPLQQAAASGSNACADQMQGELRNLDPSPWKLWCSKENSVPGSLEQRAKRVQQEWLPSGQAGSLSCRQATGQPSMPSDVRLGVSQEGTAACVAHIEERNADTGSAPDGRANGEPNSVPSQQDHTFSQEGVAAGRSLMAALRAAGISPCSTDASRPSDTLPALNNSAPAKGTANGPLPGRGAGSAPGQIGKLPAGKVSTCSGSRSKHSRDAPHRGTTSTEPPAQQHSRMKEQLHSSKAAQSNCHSSRAAQTATGAAKGQRCPELQHSAQAPTQEEHSKVQKELLKGTAAQSNSQGIAAHHASGTAMKHHPEPQKSVMPGNSHYDTEVDIDSLPETGNEAAGMLSAGNRSTGICSRSQQSESAAQRASSGAKALAKKKCGILQNNVPEGTAVQSSGQGMAAQHADDAAEERDRLEPQQIAIQANLAQDIGINTTGLQGTLKRMSERLPNQAQYGTNRSSMAAQHVGVAAEEQDRPEPQYSPMPSAVPGSDEEIDIIGERVQGFPDFNTREGKHLNSPDGPSWPQLVPDSVEVDGVVHITLVPSQQLSAVEKGQGLLPPTALEVQVCL